MAEIRRRFVTTSDGVRLRCLEAGAGRTIVLIPGGAVSADIWREQLIQLGNQYHVVSVEMRGCGESDRPPFGYRVSRLAADLHECLDILGLDRVVAVGHSLGCSILYEYLGLYGQQRFEKLVLVDEPPVLIFDPAWSAEERLALGASYDPGEIHATLSALAGPGREQVLRAMVEAMTTPRVCAEHKAFILECLSTMPGEWMARLYYNNIHQDWRDAVTRIELPTLLIGGRASLVPWQSQQWLHGQIPQSKLVILEADQGGGHFPMVENGETFNTLLTEFIG